MKEIEDKSIDMILCDLPYETTKNKWDTKLPFEELWMQYKRIIKDNGVITLFGQGMFTAELMKSNAQWWRYNLIWEKDRPTGFLNAKKMPLRSHEDILVFYKQTPSYNPIFWEGIPLHGVGTKYKIQENTNNNYNKFDSSNEIRDARKGNTQKYPRSVLRFKRDHPPIHPTQKPVDLMEYLIKTYTKKNDLILDNCIGSGTTAVACINTDRNFIGFEISTDYFNIANLRIDSAYLDRRQMRIEDCM